MTIRDIVPFGKKGLPLVREEHSPFSLLQGDINTLFDNFFRDFDMEPFETHLSSFHPFVDVAETDKEIKITAEMPGMDEKDIEVLLNEDTLTIKGEKKTEKEDKGKTYYCMERSYGSFSRTIPIHVEVEKDKIDAEFRKGVLTITLLKTAKALQDKRKIAITSG